MPPAPSTMTDAEKYAHQKELNRLRQKKYYDAHKEKLLQARKDIRTLARQTEENTDASALSTNQTFLERFESSMSSKSAASKTKYLNDIRTFMNISDCEHLEKCLKRPKHILTMIEEATKKGSGDHYSNNSKKGFIQSVLVAITELKIKISARTLKMYKDYFERLKLTSLDDNSKKQQEEKVEDFSKYLDRVKTLYGENSKAYIISKLYDEATIRDDFHLKIIKSSKESLDEKQNYIVVPTKGILTLIINSYKTEQKYGVLKFQLSNKLSSLIRSYIKTNELAYGAFLFGVTTHLTDFVSKMNKKMNIKGSITYFRQMKIAQILQDSKVNDPAKRVELASKMAHSPVVQARYFREILS
jgi:hypothetical protein